MKQDCISQHATHILSVFSKSCYFNKFVYFLNCFDTPIRKVIIIIVVVVIIIIIIIITIIEVSNF
jgi:hypothetical protein